MNLKNKVIIFIVLLLLACPIFAYSTSGEGFVAAGGRIASDFYSSLSSLGDGMVNLPILSVTADSVPPSISYIKFDGRGIINNDYVSPNVTITAKITDNSSGVDASKSTLAVDSQSMGFSSLTYGTSFVGGILTYKTNFTNGTHTLKIIAYDVAGNSVSSETITFKVEAGEAKLSTPVLCYKNPFNPGLGESTNITYMLNDNADINIYIYNLVGQLIKKISCASGSEGGHSGYNQVPWDGYSDSKELAGNDVYLIRVVSGGRVLGKCKIAVLK